MKTTTFTRRNYRMIVDGLDDAIKIWTIVIRLRSGSRTNPAVCRTDSTDSYSRILKFSKTAHSDLLSCCSNLAVRIWPEQVGAQVMLLVNKQLLGDASLMLVNGSRGVVSRLVPIADVIDQYMQQALRQRGGADLPEDDYRSKDEAIRRQGEAIRRGHTMAMMAGLEDELSGLDDELGRQIRGLQLAEESGLKVVPFVDFWNGRSDVTRICHLTDATVHPYVFARLFSEMTWFSHNMSWNYFCGTGQVETD